MPQPLTQLSIETHPACPAHIPEPDVTWGQGGIDDWGWTAWPVGTEPLTTNLAPEVSRGVHKCTTPPSSQNAPSSAW